MKFTVCIAATRSGTLDAAIASVRRQTWTDWELIVVGQGHDAALRRAGEAAAGADSRVRYIHLSAHGLSLARNAGARAACGAILAMMDDDCEADPAWLATLAEIFDREPAVGLVGGALIAPRPTRRLANCPHIEPAEALYDPVACERRVPAGWDWIGGNFAVRRSVLERAGLFDVSLGAGAAFPCAEDTDYKLRLEALGVPMHTTPRAVVYHTHGTRYGLRAVIRHSRNYARGNGALAGKLSLAGDPRGRAWLEETARDSLLGWLRPLRPQRLPVNLWRLWHFARAYVACQRLYRLNGNRGVLEPLHPHTRSDASGVPVPERATKDSR